MVVSNRNLLFQGSIFRCYVRFRECTNTDSFKCSNPGVTGIRVAERFPDVVKKVFLLQLHCPTGAGWVTSCGDMFIQFFEIPVT